MSAITTFIESALGYVQEYLGDYVDAVLDLTLIAVTAFTITGCSISPQEQVDTAVYHPAWPTPYEVCDVDWKVMVIENEPFVALSFDDNLKMAACTQDLIRYLKEMNIKFCSYRPEEDSRCAKLLKKEKKTT